MHKSLETSGTSTSSSEVTEIGAHGFWVLVDEREYFVPFQDYPVFLIASVQQVFHMERIGPRQLYWEELDADIELDV